MPSVTLEGNTLGKKHQHFNKLVKDAIANKHYQLRKISSDDSDIENLLKIHIACKTRNVDYIIEVMKCNDMLYAATAIKNSTWLVTEQQYAHIINPEYLHTQLLPSMNTKSFNKLMLRIRLNLKDESRVETFYEYLKETDRSYKWLQNCSIPFIENVINERLIPPLLFKRLCKRSVNFIAYYTRVAPGGIYTAKLAILFLLKSHTVEVMNVLEQDTHYDCPQLKKKKTEILMKKFPNKVYNDFDKYVYVIDLSVVAKYLEKKEIISFLDKQAKKNFARYITDYEIIGYFIQNIPEVARFEFVKKTFMDKTELAAFYPRCEKKFNSHIKHYIIMWYEFAPFNEALTELKKFIRKEKSSSERCAMLSVLITCARRNPQHVKTLLDLFNDRHINEPFKFKIQFVNNLLSQLLSYELDVESWNVLNRLFQSMEVYTESENNVQQCLESITLYKVLHDQAVPKIVEQKMTFNTFEKFQKKLNQDQSLKMFTYLLNSELTKVQIENISNESDFSMAVIYLMNAMILLNNWKKDISKYPNLLKIIQELKNMKQENMWKTDISCLYNVKKSWRKHMIEESLSLCMCEDACLNALKHKPQLLTRHDKEIDLLRTNDAVSLRRLLAKLRVYWPDSLAQHWIEAYFLSLNKVTGQKAVINGLFRLQSQSEIINLAKKYAPDTFKITWGKTDKAIINVRKNIAKHLHVARPLIPLDTVLWYSRGDYLQYAVPSLNAILYNMSETESRKYFPKLLEAPVSLIKCGLQVAVLKLKSNDLKSLFLEMWNSSRNLTIRSVLLKLIHNQICKAKNPTVEKELWEILSIFIDSLTSNESANIYKTIRNVKNVPISIRAKFYMKSYVILSSLPASANCVSYVKYLIQYAPKIMYYLDEDFVVNKILSPAGAKFCSYGSEVLEVFACYVLCGKSEENQIQRFEKVVEPAIDEAFQVWNSTRSSYYYIRDNFTNFLRYLSWNFRVYYLTTKALPVQLFVKIKTKMEKGLPLVENYVLFTSWKLVTEYVKVMDEHKALLIEMFEPSNFLNSKYEYRWMSKGMVSVWKDIHFKISPTLGRVIVKCLKEDTEQYNSISTIYSLFTEAFQKMFDDIFLHDEVYVLETLQHMLNDSDFIPSYFLVSKATAKYTFLWTECKTQSEIRKKIESHPSKAVRMHYHDDFQIFS